MTLNFHGWRNLVGGLGAPCLNRKLRGVPVSSGCPAGFVTAGALSEFGSGGVRLWSSDLSGGPPSSRRPSVLGWETRDDDDSEPP